jgi:hypothetical protein
VAKKQSEKSTMTMAKKLGIWMDHSSAHLIEFTAEKVETKILSSDFTHQDKQNSLGRSEMHMHNREQHQTTEYYKKLKDVILHYEDVLLFGPTDAKVELHNLLKTDHLFAKIKIEVLQADKMTENQLLAFVRKYFSNHHSGHEQ